MSTSTTTAAPGAAMSHRGVLQALSGLLLGMFVSMLASTVVSTSLPVIIHDLGGDQTAFTWVVTATLLTTAISTPVWGKLADLFNRKLLIQLAIVIFVLATAAAGFSQDTGTLIAFRAVQGIGAGGLAALSQIIMADIISPRERGRYMGLFGAVMAVATVGGPLLGGFITDTWGWRWNFFVALPFASPPSCCCSGRCTCPPREDEGPHRLPRDRAALRRRLAAPHLGDHRRRLVRVVEHRDRPHGGRRHRRHDPVHRRRAAREGPARPAHAVQEPHLHASVIASIATGIAMFGASVFLGQYMQLARGATPTEAGIMTIPMIAGLLLSSIGVGALITRFGRWKPFLIAGSVFLIAGSYLLSTIHYDTNFALVSLYMFLLGAGVGMTMQNLVLIVQNTSKPTEIGVASSGVTFFRSLGGTIGVSVMGAALATKITELMAEAKDDITTAIMNLGAKGAEIAQGLQGGAMPNVADMPETLRVIFEDIYAQGISHSFLIAVPFAVLSLIAIIFLPNVPLTRMTTKERIDASEADLATVSVPAGMQVAIERDEVQEDSNLRAGTSSDR